MKLDLQLGDCLASMADMPDASVDLILTDPPYFKVKNEPWDNQWDKPQQFLSWLDTVLAQFQRILKPNGSLYLFAGPKMAAQVECLISERFNVLNHVVWNKPDAAGAEKGAKGGKTRAYVYKSERVIFAEQKETFAKVIRAQRMARGLRAADVDIACAPSRKPTGLCYRWEHPYSHGGCEPTIEQFVLFKALIDPAASRATAEAEYAGLRRTFKVAETGRHADVWDCAPVRPYANKHPCEKPAAVLEHIIAASSNPGDTVLDAFMGTGSTGIAAIKLSRAFIGIEKAPQHFAQAAERTRAAVPQAANDGEILRQGTLLFR